MINVFHKGQVSGKWVQTRKMNDWKVWRENIKYPRNRPSQLFYQLFVLRILEISTKKKISACDIIIYRPHHPVSLLWFSEKFKKLLLKAMKKAWRTLKISKTNCYQIWKEPWNNYLKRFWKIHVRKNSCS